ncbi:MAG TPA: twin-arginine translocation signal domain-containing protein, partial [Blastocatellia bacterium]|nr:twin-arginine translocation signal domain-containing protein [Blastocatellia bacterium]
MKKNHTRRPANTAEKPAKINRRSFVKLLPAATLSGAAIANIEARPGAATANAQQAQQQPQQRITKEALRAAEQL